MINRIIQNLKKQNWFVVGQNMFVTLFCGLILFLGIWIILYLFGEVGENTVESLILLYLIFIAPFAIFIGFRSM